MLVYRGMRGTKSPLFPRPPPLFTPPFHAPPLPLVPAPSFATPLSACPVGGPPASPHSPCLARPSASLLPCASLFARPHLWGMPPFFRPTPVCMHRGCGKVRLLPFAHPPNA